ncbi:MAG: hypothetical protein ACRDPI_10250 [Nocardioidaceae bacterium]
MDVHERLAEIRLAVEHARSMPMSASAVLNRGELLAMLDALKDEMDGAFSDAHKVLAERDDVIADGHRSAAQIVADAHNERDRIVSDTEVYTLAKRQADDVLARAHDETAGMRKDIDDYVDAKLANLEISLEKTMEAVRRGRERLAGRSALDSLTSDEVDKIKLPEHLEN